MYNMTLCYSAHIRNNNTIVSYIIRFHVGSSEVSTCEPSLDALATTSSVGSASTIIELTESSCSLWYCLPDMFPSTISLCPAPSSDDGTLSMASLQARSISVQPHASGGGTLSMASLQA